jgi:hypothetical protein
MFTSRCQYKFNVLYVCSMKPQVNAFISGTQRFRCLHAVSHCISTVLWNWSSHSWIKQAQSSPLHAMYPNVVLRNSHPVDVGGVFLDSPRVSVPVGCKRGMLYPFCRVSYASYNFGCRYRDPQSSVMDMAAILDDCREQ